MDLAQSVAMLRIKLGDESRSKITDNKYLENELISAMNKHNPDYTLDTLPEEEEYLVIKLAQISCLYTLASREAKNYSISVDGITINKSDRVRNYLSLAQSLEEDYEEIVNSPSFAKIEVENFKRYSASVNRLVGGNDG